MGNLLEHKRRYISSVIIRSSFHIADRIGHASCEGKTLATMQQLWRHSLVLYAPALQRTAHPSHEADSLRGNGHWQVDQTLFDCFSWLHVVGAV